MQIDNNHMSHSQKTLNQMAMYWGERASVKQEEFDTKLAYNPELDDFLDELIPLRHHPKFQEHYEEY